VRCAITRAVVDCGSQLRTLTGGNTELQPEESKQWSIGLIAEPLPPYAGQGIPVGLPL
jgi:hypothetical protein